MTIREASEAQAFAPEAGKFYDGLSNEAYRVMRTTKYESGDQAAAYLLHLRAG